MKKNEQYTVECVALTDLAAGVCRIDEEAVFVYDLLPGEKARIQIIKTYSKYAIGKVIERLTTSQARQEPVCPVAKWCGGCQMQHIAYAEQCGFKNQWLQDLFRTYPLLPIRKAEDPLLYRNKAQFPVQVRNGKVEMGFYRLHSNTIVDTKECFIQSPAINKVFLWIKEHISLEQARCLRHVMIREGKDHIQVVFIGERNIDLNQFTARMTKRFSEIESVVFNENRRNDNVILGEKYDVLYKNDWIMAECMGNRIKLHFKSFFQVDPAQTEILYQTAIDLAQLKKEDRLVELYAGTGTIGMAMAPYVKEVTGVEIVKEAVDNANENVRLNHIENCSYICQDATAFAREYEGECDVLVVDPPRKGLSEEGIGHIERIAPKKMIYISCNPKTLRRDLDRLKERGYDCSILQPVDMFPYTTGIECVALIEKRKER